MDAVKKSVPTSVRLSPDTKRRLEAAARRQNRSQSFIVEQVLHANLDPDGRLSLDTSDRLKSWQAFFDSLPPAGAGRTVEEIDADIRAMREDRAHLRDP